MATRVLVSGIVEKNGKFLVLKRAETARFAPNQWEFVNGTISESETAEEALVRELKEESKLELNHSSKLPSYEIRDRDGDWVVIPFRVQAIGDVEISGEHSEFKWVEPEELSNLEGVSEDWQIIRKHLDD